MVFKFEGKGMSPSLVLQRVVGQFTPMWWGLARMRTANREKHSHTNSTVSRQVYVDVLLVQHLCRPSVFFQHKFWYGPRLETAWMQRRQKNW